jgi:hypothetical protein
MSLDAWRLDPACRRLCVPASRRACLLRKSSRLHYPSTDTAPPRPSTSIRRAGGDRQARPFDRISASAASVFVREPRSIAHDKHGFALIDAGELPASFPRMDVDSRFYRRRLG